MRLEHLRGVIWRRNNPIKGCYAYAIVGVLVTNEPLDTIEGRNEVFIDVNCGGISYSLEAMKKYTKKRPAGDAGDVLCSLENLPDELEEFKEDKKKKKKMCKRCKKVPATKKVDEIVDRLEVEKVHVCNKCAIEIHDFNKEFGN